MANSVLKRILKAGMVKASAWGTSVDPGATHGFFVQEVSGIEYRRKMEPDRAAGFGFESNAEQGSDEPLTVGITAFAYEADRQTLMLLSMMFGSVSVAGGSDPYTHTGTVTDESDYMVTFAWQEGDEVKAIPTAKVTELSLSFNDNGTLNFEASLLGPKVSIASSTLLDDVTYSASSAAFQLRNATFRINAQSGDALDSGDDLEISDVKLTMSRPMDQVYVTNLGHIAEPKGGEYPEFKLEFTIPRKNATAKTLYTAWAAETLQKATLTIAGSSASRELSIILPQLKLESVDFPFEDIIPCKVVARIQKASSNPSGMSSTYPQFTWKTAIAASTLS